MFVLILYSTVSSRLNGGAPNVFGVQIMAVLSGSMEPKIQTGSIIGVKPVNPDQKDSFKPGDVITFKSVDDANILITHRIVEVKKEGTTTEYVTRGDNNDAADPTPVPSTNVIAKYVNITIPYLGFFLDWVKTKMGIACILIIPGILMILSSMYSLYKKLLEAQKSQEKQSGDVPPATQG
jgi:signal peptidase